MGEPVSTALIASAVIGTVAKGGALSMNFAAERDSKRSLELKSKQNELQAAQRSVDTLTRVNAAMDRSAAASSVSGASTDSQIFQGKVLDTQRYGAKELSNIEAERAIGAANIEAERRNVKRKLIGQIFGFVASGANSFDKVYGSVPKGKG